MPFTYRDTLHAAFGRPPYTWEVLAGELPPGLELRSNGDLRGTATEPGSFTFEVRAADEQGATAQAEVTLVVEEDATPRIITERLPELNQGAPFEIQLEAESREIFVDLRGFSADLLHPTPIAAVRAGEKLAGRLKATLENARR